MSSTRLSSAALTEATVVEAAATTKTTAAAEGEEAFVVEKMLTVLVWVSLLDAGLPHC